MTYPGGQRRISVLRIKRAGQTSNYYLDAGFCGLNEPLWQFLVAARNDSTKP
jgi:hypothetical protein